jgi:Protein of unknown function (DUF3987)
LSGRDPAGPDGVIGLVLGKLDGVRGQSGYWMARCPAHEDSTASLSVKRGTTQPVLVYCHAGCDPRDVIGALGLDWSEVCADRDGQNGHHKGPVVVAEYPYTDEQGEVLFVKERKEPKDFLIKRPDGRGGWIYNLGATRRVILNLPAVQQAIKDGQPVYITEGEKDARAVMTAGAVATCNYDGAAKEGQRTKVRPEYADMLRGAIARVVADDDGSGIAHAREWAKVLAGKAASIELLKPAEGKDAYDHLVTHRRTLADLVPFDQPAVDDPVVLAAIPSYPVEAIPGPLRQLVDGGTAMGLHEAFLGGAGLAALASVCGPATLVLSGSWEVWPKIWVPIIDYPSTGKTPAHKLAFRRIHQMDRAVMDAYKQELAGWKDAGGEDSGTDQPPRPIRRLAGDVTTEVLCRWLDSGDQTGCIAVDELKAFIHGIGYYGSGRAGRDFGRWMELWSSQPWSMMRVGDGGAKVGIDLYLGRPVVSICGCLTPGDQELLGREGDGFRPRWLPHLGPGLYPIPTDADPDLSSWDAAVTGLYDNREPRTWFLRGMARTRWERAARRWKERARGPETPSVAAALGKADEQCARVALIIAESLTPGRGGDIPDSAVTAAIAITDYVLDCWAAMGGSTSFAVSKYGEALNKAVDELEQWLERQPGRKAARSEIHNAHVAGVRKAKDLDVLLADYRDTYPGTIHTEQPDGAGRPRTTVCAPVRSNYRPLANNSDDPPVGHQGGDITAGQSIASDTAEFLAMANNSAGQKFVANNSAAGPGVCAGCGGPLDPALAAAGFTDHGGDCHTAREEKSVSDRTRKKEIRK